MVKYRVYYLTFFHQLRSELFDSLREVDNFCKIRYTNNILHIETEVVWD